MLNTDIKNKFYMYIVKCQDDTFYIGHTHDINQRIQTHRSGNGSKHTSERRVDELVYYESYDSKKEAIKREKQLKGWSRLKKEALINKDFNRLKKLSISRQSVSQKN